MSTEEQKARAERLRKEIDNKINKPVDTTETPKEFIRGFGALPPSHLAWSMGKTAASIDFVSNAERYLLEITKQAVALQNKIDKIKSGEEVLTKHLSVEEFLYSLPTNKHY